MKKIAIICALEKELNPIKALYETNVHNNRYQADFFLSGYGRSKAVAILSKLLTKNQTYEAIINIGTCGLKLQERDFSLFKNTYIFEPTLFIDGDFTLENERRELLINIKTPNHSLPLVTVSDFGRYDKYMKESYIEDMEGFEIVNIAQTLNIPCKIIKVVSNAITENPETDMAEFQANCHNVMEQNAQNILKCINNFINKYLL